LYTERIPCGAESANCYGWIQTLRNARVEYTFASQMTSRGWVQANDDLFQFYYSSFDEFGNIKPPRDVP
ncbi:MAG TPA: hypothetical protein VFS59_16350, partial [Gemmatimonadaceae bacterium]|nr:hypothetical protein [Gemmatimonadaceae bacterium]